MIWLELAILLACIVVGARLGGMALGPVAGIGLTVFVFAFGLPPGNPPAVVLGMIIAVVTALATMEAAGGLDYLVLVAERILRKRPQYITFVAPLVTYVLIFASGTQHVIYALLPVIAEVSRKAGIRPERPIAISVIAAQHGLIASPISAATVALIGVLARRNIGLPQIMTVIVPSTLLAVLIGACSVAWKGTPLADDPGYQERLTSGKVQPPRASRELAPAELVRARGSTLLFLAGIAFVVLLGLFPGLRPSYSIIAEGKASAGQVDPAAAIMIVMLAIGGLILLLFKASPDAAMKGSVMRGGLSAVISILGISWLGSSFFAGNEAQIVGEISSLIQRAAWLFALGLFFLSALLFSQAATVVTLMPVGLALGLSSPLLVAMYPAVNGAFFLPTYGTVLAAVAFDQTGTTRIGKYLLNHSFMLPGLVTTISATLLALLFSALVIPH
jgi:anaerobic C4-dicarboxylate transporter DcuA